MVIVDPQVSVANHSLTAPKNLGHLLLSSRNTVIQTRPTPTASTITLTMVAGVVLVGAAAQLVRTRVGAAHRRPPCRCRCSR